MGLSGERGWCRVVLGAATARVSERCGSGVFYVWDRGCYVAGAAGAGAGAAQGRPPSLQPRPLCSFCVGVCTPHHNTHTPTTIH